MNPNKPYIKSITFFFPVLVIALLSASCAEHTGTFSVGNPTALTPKKSSESLGSYAQYLQDRISLKLKGSDIE